ncbi:MAG: shikimate dehydrogenase [Candidatus Omnitrophica bacterium]|nr:shikimate dehydrogenase [Candidatus Omnitrophota bacterium]
MSINGKTKIFGIIGWPVAHSRSPAMHNAAFERLGINAAYVPFEVNAKNLKNALSGIKALGICGVNVTIPHKEAVIKYLNGLTREAKAVGAVNTIVNKNGGLIGHNTDVFGFLKSLREDLGFHPGGKTAFVLGAGGAAKAVGYGLASMGAVRIVFSDAVEEKAIELACEIELKTKCECIALRPNSPGFKEMILNSRLLVNATPRGMREGDPISVKAEYLHKALCVFDLIYNRETKLVRAARKNGIKTTGGLNMLLYQGARAFELWTGKRAPIGVMRKAARR